MATHKVDNNNFKSDVLQSAEPVVVDFWAEWCGPCKMIAPSLEEIATELNGKVKIAKLNIDENPELAAQFGVRSIPTLMVFREKVLLFSQPGALPASGLEAVIRKVKEIDIAEVHRDIAAQEAAEADTTT